jgi:ubiquinone/menaquinone biosynthesis C-methylase UbiE
VLRILRYLVFSVAIVFLLREVRKPSKWVGRFFLWMMNLTHSSLTDWGLKHVTVGKTFTILDVGCGGGRTIQKLAAMATEGAVYGVDYANGSVAASRAKNARSVQTGRVAIAQGTVSGLPFAESSFDLVTAVETQYYWPDLVADMREIRRVLKPGGTLIIMAESYKKAKTNKLLQPVMKVLSAAYLSLEEERELFLAAGFQDVETFEEPGSGWMCATGKKAGAT